MQAHEVCVGKTCGGTLGRDPERARGRLARLLEPIALRRDGDKLVAEMRGNLPALLDVNEELYNRGSGRPALRLPTEVYRLL